VFGRRNLIISDLDPRKHSQIPAGMRRPRHREA